jgi:hypothetical protein
LIALFESDLKKTGKEQDKALLKKNDVNNLSSNTDSGFEIY